MFENVKEENVVEQTLETDKENYLHFELRKGTESLDPEPLFK